MYQFLRPLFFLVNPETVHHLVFTFLRIPGVKNILRIWYDYQNVNLSKEVFGLRFRNPVGLAAGFDKDAKLIDELDGLGFGFIEIGTLTPRPQAGNPKPRLFRLPKDRALINRMGFNNEGVLAAVDRLKKRNTSIIVGGNIGKNKDTPNEKALDDYAYCFQALYNYVDYFVVNVSSPNTPGLRELQEKEPLQKLLAYVKGLSLSQPKPKPILLKIAPDLNDSQLLDIVSILQLTKIDGVIATNTTISRDGLLTDSVEVETIGNGGLSGKPLSSRSTEVIQFLRKNLGAGFPIIGVGGIMSTQDAIDKLKAGADLIQIYTGFIYEGPGFAKAINRKLIAERANAIR
jgi:dihydroorotate dehydrogenase